MKDTPTLVVSVVWLTNLSHTIQNYHSSFSSHPQLHWGPRHLSQANSDSSPSNHRSRKRRQTMSELVPQTTRSEQWAQTSGPLTRLSPTMEEYSDLERSFLSLQFVHEISCEQWGGHQITMSHIRHSAYLGSFLQEGNRKPTLLHYNLHM